MKNFRRLGVKQVGMRLADFFNRFQTTVSFLSFSGRFWDWNRLRGDILALEARLAGVVIRSFDGFDYVGHETVKNLLII